MADYCFELAAESGDVNNIKSNKTISPNVFFTYKYEWDGEETVDLGLPSGTLWCTCNLGANTTYDKGDYYMWADTIPATSGFNVENAKYCEGRTDNGYLSWSKYTTNTNYNKNGIVDNKTVLDTEDDAAYYSSDGKYKMPTQRQFEELVNDSYTVNAYISWNDNLKCVIIVSRKNGKAIFFPCCGYFNENNRGETTLNLSDWFYYRTSSLYGTFNNTFCSVAEGPKNSNSNSNRMYMEGQTRYYGVPIRPVLNK